MMRLRFALVGALGGALLLPALGSAQGTLGSQGFGYPAGEMGARASATAGALAPFDAVSAVNPATVTAWQRTVIFFHLEPEYRSTSVNGATASTNEVRFPLIGGAVRISDKFSLGVTFSTYLDRTWQTVASQQEHLGQDSVLLTTRYSSSGAISDLRAALGWTVDSTLKIGIGVHVYTGQNRLAINWDFPDSTPFGDVAQTTTLTYSGSGMSLGVEWKPSHQFELAAYGRTGGEASMRIGDTLLSRARMPQHLGFAAHYDGLTGTVIAAGWEHIGWSSLRNLGENGLDVHDANRISVGAESRGPSVAKVPVFIRLGVAHRDLPFEAAGKSVTETLVTGGLGYTIAHGSANVDLSLQHAHRTAGSMTESAWVWTLGLAITP